MNWLIERLKEPTTWRGIIWLATALGVSLRPEVWEQIAAVGMALAGLVGVITRENTAIRVELPPIELVAKAGAVSGFDAGVVAGDSAAGGMHSDAMQAECGRGPGPVDGDPKTGWNG